MAMWKKKGTFTSIHATFDSSSNTEQCKSHRTPWCSALYLLWEYTGWPVTPQDNQVPCFRRVFIAFHVMFSSMTGIHLLNSASSPQHSHQNFVLKGDNTLGTDCTEKAVEIKTLSFSNRNEKEETTVLGAYLKMTGSSSKKGKKKASKFMRTVTEEKLQNQSLLPATVQDNRTSLQGNWLMKAEGHTVTQKQVNKALALRS